MTADTAPPLPSAGDAAELRAEDRRRQLPRAIVLGALAGLAAVAFTRILEAADAWRTSLIESAHGYAPAGIVVPVLVGALGAGLAAWLVHRFAPETSGSGIQHLESVLHHGWTMRGLRVVAVKFAGGVAGIGGGLALGREGPTIQMGGALGQIVSGWFGSSTTERRALVAAGAGAGLAAAFNAPLSGLVFVLEEVQRDFSPAIFTATLVASVTADTVARLSNGQLPVFHVQTQSIPPIAGLPVSVVVGVAAGALGVAFNRALVGSLDAFRSLRRWPAWAHGALAGGIVGTAGWFIPDAMGGGYALVEQTLAGQVALLALPGFFALRFLLTMVSYGCGAPGGIFAPLLVLGAEIGLAIGILSHRLAPEAVLHAETFAVVGMAAYFAAIVRAPLTGIVLVVEMTGNYSLVLPLLAACLTADAVADFLGGRPIYDVLLERDLRHGDPSARITSALTGRAAPP